MPTDFLIFDVGLGQSIFVYPRSAPAYGSLIDCGNSADCEPIDFLVENGFVTNGTLSNLTLTNYDQDHFSGLPYLRRKVGIDTVNFAKNLSSDQLKAIKEQPHTEALKSTLDVKDKYTTPAQNYKPPFAKKIFSLSLEDALTLDRRGLTNNLSQVVFIDHLGSVLCVGGDLEEAGWQLLLRKQPDIKPWLARTNVFVASHHGRDNGHCADVFCDCDLDCVIISDKDIVHDTQDGMASLYAGHVSGGITLSGANRKVLTTRDDGHLWVRFDESGQRSYGAFSI